MASLIGWLAESGARTSAGAAVASGTAWFYQPGTFTARTVFSDADGLAAITQPVALDAAGRATVYTKTPCRIVVQDSTGLTVLDTDRGNTLNAAQVEIENANITGTDVAGGTGAQVLGGRTDLDSFLGALADTLNAPTGSVSVGAGNQPFGDAITTLGSIFNVKASTFGAVGDGINDDTAAINRALAALVAAGGGILFFPPGTYKNTGLDAISTAVTILGCGPRISILSIATFNYILNVQSNGSVRVANMGFSATTAPFVQHLSDDVSVFTGCRFVCGVTSTFPTFYSSSTIGLNLIGCEVVQTGAAKTTGIFSGATVTGGAVYFESGPVVDSTSISVLTVLSGVRIKLTATSGTVSGFTAGINVSLTDCHLTSAGGTFNLVVGTRAFKEHGCIFGANVAFASDVPVVSDVRDSTFVRVSGSAASYTPDPSNTRGFEIASSNGAFQWNTPSPSPSAGTTDLIMLFLRYSNTSGGAVTPTFGAGLKGTLVSVSNSNSCSWLFLWDSTRGIWSQVGQVVTYTS